MALYKVFGLVDSSSPNLSTVSRVSSVSIVSIMVVIQLITGFLTKTNEKSPGHNGRGFFHEARRPLLLLTAEQPMVPNTA